MASQKQIEANRRNARRSTGPRTAAGKAVSKRNAVKHGVLSSNAVSPYEDRERYDALQAQLVSELEPETALECALVERLTNLLWREKRLAEAETEKFTMRNRSADEARFGPSSRTLLLKDQHLIGRYQGMLGRQMRETLQDFHREKEHRLQLVEQDERPKS